MLHRIMKNKNQQFKNIILKVNYVIKLKCTSKGTNVKLTGAKEINLNAFTIPKSIDRMA